MKLERLLAIVMMLVNRPRVQARELAERFEVSVRTIYRDIETINQAGLPVVAYPGAGGGIGFAEGYRIDRNFLTSDELAAVFIALRGAAAYDERRTGAVLEKIRGMVPEVRTAAFRAKSEHTIIDLSPWNENPGLRDLIGLLQEAILACRRISFAYWSPRGDATAREVEPYVLVLKGQNWYLYGFCRLRQAFRLFKLSRMRQTVALPEPFVRAEVDLSAAPWQSEWQSPTNMVGLLLRFDARARALVEDFFGPDRITIDEAGRLVVKASFPEDDWVYSFILSFGPWVEVLEPSQIRERIREMAEGVTRLYRLPGV